MKFDFPGFLLVGAGFALLQFGMENVAHSAVSGAAVSRSAAHAVLAFSAYARRVAAPAVDLTLFRLRSFAVGTLAGGLCRMPPMAFPFCCR